VSRRKIIVNSIEYHLERRPGAVRLKRRDPTSGLEVENVFPSRPAQERLDAFKKSVAQLVLDDLSRES
jgi:hypothetical protein